MIPSQGRVVQYTLSEGDVAAINKRRLDAQGAMVQHRENSNGVQVHIGNEAREGDTYPLVIVRVWDYGKPTEDALVNGQLLLDGNDTYWVTSVKQGEGPRTWREFPRV